MVNALVHQITLVQEETLKMLSDGKTSDPNGIQIETSSDMKQVNIQIDGLREQLLQSAVQFLLNPKVQHTNFNQRIAFLKSKGLTEEEVQEALRRSKTGPSVPNLPSHVPSMNLQPYPSIFPPWFVRFRDGVQTIAVFTGIIYALYLFYKRYIYPWLFGDKKKKTIEQKLDDIDATVEEVKTAITGNATTAQQIDDLKVEVATIKGLLLDRKSFPPMQGPFVPPSIPAWQLSSASHAAETERDDKEHDTGSGSGSSETEVVTKNSDSSIEIV